jgi:hypothetical protein
VPLETRRELLSDIAADLKTPTPLLGVPDTLDTTPAELIPLVKEFGCRASSPSVKTPVYEIGKRSGAWLKYNVNKAQGVRDWRLHARQPAGCVDRRLLRGRQAHVCEQGAQRVRAEIAA